MKGYNLGARINQREKESFFLYWDLQTSQGQMINILDFVGHIVFIVTPQLIYCSMKQTETIYKWMGVTVGSYNIVFTETGIEFCSSLVPGILG